VAFAATPANDDFADAEDLGSTLPVNIARSNVEATKETGEPFDVFAAGHSVWFEWEAPGDGFVTVGTCDASFTTRLRVFTGTALISLTEVVSGNDDEGPHCPDEGREFTFRATSGTAYKVAVDGSGFSFGPPPVTEGEFTLRIEATPSPTNDDFQNAVSLDGQTSGEPGGERIYRASALGYTWGAGKEAGEPNHGGNVGGASVWYAWTAPASGSARITACCGWLPLLGVYTGSSVGGLISAELAPGPALAANVAVNAGVTYRIAVDGEFDSGSGFAKTGSFGLTALMQLPSESEGPSANTPPSPPADVTRPKTTMGKRTLRGRRAVFRFTSNEHGRFRCKLDKRLFAECRSPKIYRNVKPGRHIFRVFAIDDAGNRDRSPAVARFVAKGR
jgi:hypothetical protein